MNRRIKGQYKWLALCLTAIIVFMNACTNGNALSSQNEVVTIDSLDITYPLPSGDDILPMSEYNANGQKLSTIEDLKAMISPEDISIVQQGNYTVAVCMHEYYTQWSKVLINGLRDTLEKFNISLLAVTDGQMDTNRMISNLESLAALKPDVIVVYNLSTNVLTPAVKDVIDKGIKVQFIGEPTLGLQYGKDYGAIVMPDDYQMGYVSAEFLAQRIGGKGEIALLQYEAINNNEEVERRRGYMDALKNYPDIQIAVTELISNNEDAAKKTELILEAHPNIKGIWASWDQPAMAAATIIQNKGKEIYVTGPDIGKESAYSLSSDGLFVGTGSQQPYLQGVAEALNIVVSLSGKTPPQYVQTPAVKVTKENLSSVWEVIYHEEFKAEPAD